jgi:hypothetical protein
MPLEEGRRERKFRRRRSIRSIRSPTQNIEWGFFVAFMLRLQVVSWCPQFPSQW